MTRRAWSGSRLIQLPHVRMVRNSAAYELAVGKLSALQSAGDEPHLVDGVELAAIVPSDEPADVPLEVLRGELVEGSLVCPLQHAPERLHAVRMDLPRS